MKLTDGRVYLLPGDSVYPTNIDVDSKLIIDKSTSTIEEFRKETPILHRIEKFSKKCVIQKSSHL